MIDSTNIGGRDCLLILEHADWTEGVRLKMRLDSKVTTGHTRRENRQPEHLLLRLAQRFPMVLYPAAAEALRQAIATGGDLLYAVPVWGDFRPYADYANRYFDASYWLTFDDALENYAVNTGTYTNFVPLMFGKLTSDTIKAFLEDHGDYELAIVESSPPTHKLAPRSVTVDSDWPASFVVNWDDDPTETHSTGFEYITVGKMREMQLENPDLVFRWEQAAHLTLGTAPQISDFLNFWYNKRGRIRNFNAPMFFKPGAVPTAEAPHDTWFRFGGSEIEILFDHPSLAEIDFRIVQVPWEINPVAGEAPEQPAEASLIQIDYEVPGKASQYFTDWEEEITWNSQTWLTHPVDVDTLDSDIKLQKLDAKLVWHNAGANPLLPFIVAGLERRVKVTIYLGDPENVSTFTQEFVGHLAPVKTSGRKITTNFKAFKGKLDRRLPGFVIQRGCNYNLGDPITCKLNLETLKNTGTGATADLAANGLSLEIRSVTGTLSVGVLDPDSQQWDRWAGGFIEVGTGDDYQIRSVVKSEFGTGTDRILYFDRPLDSAKLAAAGSPATVNMYPGCSGAKWECQGAHNNYVNFGGHPYGPDQLRELQGSNNNAGAK